MKQATALQLVVMSCVVLGPGAARAGTTSARPPPLQVNPTPAARPPPPDDLPAPPLEAEDDVARVELPAIPDFDRAPPALATPPAIPRAPAVPVSERARNLSIDALNACHAALVAGRYDAAITGCRSALAAWPGNHRAWYGSASAHTANREWSKAQAAVEHAVALRPDVAMYQMLYGITLYHAGWQRAGAAPGSRGDPPAALAAARAALLRAVAIAPALWRAQYYLGCIERDRHADRAAAEHFVAGIRANPAARGGYVALAELYRARDHAEAALAVATLGTQLVRAADSASLWFEVAMAHDALHEGTAAVAALERAIALRPSDLFLKLERGRLSFQRGQPIAAQRDLEEVARSTDPAAAAVARRARQLLEELARDGMLAGATYRSCRASRGCYPVAVSNQTWMGEAMSVVP